MRARQALQRAAYTDPLTRLPNRAAVVAATVSALASKGFVADTVDVRKSSATIKFIKPTPKAPEPTPAKPAPTIAETLVAMGKFATLAEAEAFLA